jgi:hypothetical protein
MKNRTRKFTKRSVNKKIGGSKTKKHHLQCHPAKRHRAANDKTCINKSTIDRLKRIHPDVRDVDSLMLKHGCNDDHCLLQKASKPVQEILLRDFRPKIPESWKNQPNEWLSNEDIFVVLKQYEEACPQFHIIGPSPIDFDTILDGGSSCVLDDLCRFSIEAEIKRGKTCVAIVFNLDKHDQSGSHWTSMFIDIPKKRAYYFDSAKNDLPPEVDAFVKRVAPEFTFVSNHVQHQQSNTECGMYSLFFVIEMLMKSSANRVRFFESRFNNSKRRISDATVEKFRRIYFLPIFTENEKTH